MTNKSLKENDITQLLNDTYKSDLSDFSESLKAMMNSLIYLLMKLIYFYKISNFLIMKMMIVQK